MDDKVRKYLFDIQVSIDSIYEYIGEKRDFFEYQTNKLLRRGVERELEIIGEALNRILKLDENIKISSSKRIVGLRNFIIHNYDKVDDTIIWGIISKDLLLLKSEVKLLMKE